ncbi:MULTISPECIES: glycoside hydrolase family 2 protein [unclassified Sphingomonas]|jgi:beta-galactosidase/beta-glucuronidase|uniref:glycoside hydrolase family 2 protein n=2 Tax=Sphingomonas TaxID=13687 RepID=UPI000829A7C6|nr:MULTISPECIES: glycoside hydrolase family 2 [unclassified Sphingomonas]
MLMGARLTVMLLALALDGTAIPASGAPDGVVAGPFNLRFPPASDGIETQPAPAIAPLAAWTLTMQLRAEAPGANDATVVRLPGASPSPAAAIVIDGTVFGVRIGDTLHRSSARVRPGHWHALALASDGRSVRLHVDGREAAVIGASVPISGVIQAAPRARDGSGFAGRLAQLSLHGGVREPATAPAQAATPDEDWQYESGSPAWPLQTRQQMGQTVPQPPATRPAGAPPAPAVTRVAATATDARGAIRALGDDRWELDGWRLRPAPDVAAGGASIARVGFDAGGWIPAQVPGTVLTAMVAAGIYPDPTIGLNNLAIPEHLARQDYWYRTEFDASALTGGAFRTLTFNGINYAAEIWLNGVRLGTVKGAFRRGQFDVSDVLRAGRNALAVRISPPPHPGLPHEESVLAGPGENGGAMTIDGPTFVASEGWDWIPTVRDRNTGIWQNVVIAAQGPVAIGDPSVSTVLPLPDNSVAELTVEVPLENRTASPVPARLQVQAGTARIEADVTVAPGHQVVTLTPASHPALRIRNPALWWPNGFGAPTLHDLTIAVTPAGSTRSDRRQLRFGIREVGYELSLVAPDGALQRVLFHPTRADHRAVVDVSHGGIRKVAGGWAASLRPDAAMSPAVRALPADGIAPHLILRVNGVRIPVRGGNWGMDDLMKRVDRARLEPYVRLHRDANLNTIRNWVGQNTEEALFALADEYGLMVVNDFWISTQDYNGEPGDAALFLANAEDTIRRFRHHPSIVLWLGRNEGVPPPVLNEGLEALVRTIDGTRYYTGNSRSVNMADSGPWDYQRPERYFTDLAQGFSTEVGTPSFPTLEAFRAMVPAADQWPPNDSWAYHDWHSARGGSVAGFMAAMTERLGAPADLEDFERKAQLLNFESHRAIFEGMNARLFTRNSGRLLWMTQPAWPSTEWQMLSHDYDTHASFYAIKSAAEPVHVQLNQPEDAVAVVNSLPTALAGAQVTVRRLGLDGRPLSERQFATDVPASATRPLADATLPKLAAGEVELVRLELRRAGDPRIVSRNDYWRTGSDAALRSLNDMPRAHLSFDAPPPAPGAARAVVAIRNESTVPALQVKLTLVDADGGRILPAYYDDNYLTLFPGETRTVGIAWPESGAPPAAVRVRGWNVADAAVDLSLPARTDGTTRPGEQ